MQDKLVSEVEDELKTLAQDVSDQYSGYTSVSALPNEQLFRQSPMIGPYSTSPSVLATL